MSPDRPVLVIDNYDSFTYNLVQYLAELGEEVLVRRNDDITLPEITQLDPVAAVLSPGPGTPAEAGICKGLLLELGPTLPTLGVCLGHQCLGEAFGGRVRRASRVMHGKVSQVTHDAQSIFSGLPSPFRATRYHSLVVERESLPPELEITAWTDDGTVMGLKHRQYPLVGVQFHPEAILTEHGHQLLTNFLKGARRWRPENVKVRRALLSDAADIARIHVESWKVTYRGQVPDQLLDSLSVEQRWQWRTRTLAGAAPDERTWVIEVGDRVVGFADTGPSRDDDATESAAELYAIYMDPRFAGRGLGGRLLESAVDDLKARGFAQVTLWVLATNAKTQKFYESHGWLADGSKKMERRGGFELHDVRYRKRLL